MYSLQAASVSEGLLLLLDDRPSSCIITHHAMVIVSQCHPLHEKVAKFTSPKSEEARCEITSLYINIHHVGAVLKKCS
jgi:hypothetical protein